ncbi:DUF4249 domain-containing protein [Aestuariivivens marinum]|uniref:DUF4249 domain-containing protein n=1 Tax=Aestuariivivens marinum TaxID=2913555 RepID=UPI001F5A3AE4|nr:DUF4249 domain-containing protein [Aestuariivivens marinum]
MEKLIYIMILVISFSSCEDVIDVDLKTTDPRLVIDANINWVNGTTGNLQFVKLTLTAPFFNDDVPPATGATVVVSDAFNNTYNFIEEGLTGVYKNDSFVPEINGIYHLTIIYNNETFTATEQLMPVSSIEYVEQKNDGGFSGNETEIEAYYTDPKGINNYYLFEFINTSTNIVSLEVYDDEFTDGNQIFAFHSEEDLETGDILEIRNYGISKQFFEYLSILLQQSDEESGDPFEVQPATVRGNCINETNPKNYPLGYFRASQVDTFTYDIK